jgi:hypothetical protein
MIKSVLSDLDKFLSDNEGASSLRKDGSYSQVKPSARSKATSSAQQTMLEESVIKSNQLLIEKSLATTRKSKD